ncbi:MAG: hypothetical protein JXA57_07000, partial [Armatimonadetes bacterium]|nr:hypothetical protein [Armatimonadota bacterium]
GEAAEVPPGNVWVCTTHTMSAPHILPGDRQASQADRQKNAMLAAAVEAAVRSAASEAAIGLREARIGHASGTCDVNVNRDIHTADGWWLGCNETGFSDKTVTVIRFETPDGDLISLLFTHPVRPAVMERPPGSSDPALVTADLAGAACGLIEEEYGDTATALFFMGAAGDQAPSVTGAGLQYVGKGGSLRAKGVGDRGHAVAEMLGARLGAEVLRLSESIECRNLDVPIVSETAQVRFEGQRLPDTRSLRPTSDHVFVEGSERLEPLAVVALGESVLVGVRPELSCKTGVDIRERSPYARTLVLCMVNGGAKCMADATAYDRMTYESMNSPFARGSAERMAEEAVAVLAALRQGADLSV